MAEATVRCPKCGHEGIVITEILNSDLALISDHQQAEIERLKSDLDSETHWAAQYHADLQWANTEIERLRDAVLFFSRHYDGPPDNMLTERDRDLFAMPELIRAARAAGGE